MLSKKKWLCDAKLYLILDTQVNGYRQLLDILEKSVASGVDIVQLRDKCGSAKDIIAFAKQAKKIINGRIPFIINDRADVALIVDADGVHVGQEDLSVKDARRILGPKKIVGLSCQTLAHVKEAQTQGADYVGFGSVFKTKTKPGRMPMDLKLLRTASHATKLPLFAIGGINRENAAVITNLGVTRVAVCRDVVLSENAAQVILQLKKQLAGLKKLRG